MPVLVEPTETTRQGLQVFKQGFLTKQGGRFKTFKTRFFALLDDGRMKYYRKIDDDVALGEFSIRQMTETRRLHFPKENLHGFEIVTPQRNWRFQCLTEKEANDWINVVHAVLAHIEATKDTNTIKCNQLQLFIFYVLYFIFLF